MFRGKKTTALIFCQETRPKLVIVRKKLRKW